MKNLCQHQSEEYAFEHEALSVFTYIPAMQVTTFKVRTVRSREGGYSNPVATWVHGADNDLDSIAGSHQELLNKALSQAKCSGLPSGATPSVILHRVTHMAVRAARYCVNSIAGNVPDHE